MPKNLQEPLDEFDAVIDAFLQARTVVCHEYAMTVDHQHTIGCLLVMKHMKDNHPNMKYGTQAQWTEEAAFCQRHEREIFKRTLLERLGEEKTRLLLELLGPV